MEKVRLGEVVLKLESGGRPKGGAIKEGIFSIGGEHLTADGGFDFSSGKYIPKNYFLKMNGGWVKENDILIVKDGATTGKTSFVDETFPLKEAAINEHVFRLEVDKSKSEPKYCFYFLFSNFGYRQIMSDYKGAAIGGISRQILHKIEIPLPSLSIQKAIAAQLDKADELIRYNRQLLEKYDELQQSLFLEMFGDPVVNEKGWEKRKLEKILNFLTSGSRGWAKYYSTKGDIFLRIQNIGYNKLKLTDITYVKTPTTTEAKRTKVKEGDVILSITADLGRTAVIPKNLPDSYINQHLAILRINEDNNPIFISAYIASKGGQSLISKLDKGGVKAGLNFKDIKSYEIFDVPLSLQNQFAAHIESIEFQKEQVKKALEKSEDIFKGLLQKHFGE